MSQQQPGDDPRDRLDNSVDDEDEQTGEQTGADRPSPQAASADETSQAEG